MNYYDQELAHNAMCILEAALADRDVYDWLAAGEGAAAVRMHCLELAPYMETAFQCAARLGFDDAFDWEFVPWVMSALVEATHRPRPSEMAWAFMEDYRERHP